MQQHPKHAALLRRMFTEEEWLLLTRDRRFTLAVRDCGDTLDDVERLATLGEQLIQSRKDALGPDGHP